jgi:hypothetical protein
MWVTRSRNLNEGNLAGGAIYGVQCPAGDGNQPGRMTITAQASPGSELYDSGWGRLINCVTNASNGYTRTAPECATPFVDTRELHGTVSSHLEFARVQLNGSCDSGLVLKALFKSSEGDALPYLSGSLAGDQVTVNVGDGIVNLAGK